MALTLAGRRTAHRTLAALGLAAIIVTGCAAPGAVATPTPRHGRTGRLRPRASRPAPSASAEARCRTAAPTRSRLSIYHETISELMPQLSEEFTKQFPNVTLEHPRGPVRQPHAQNAAPARRATTRPTSPPARSWSTWSRTACS